MTACTLDRPGATVRFWDDGPRGAPMVLLLHGAALDHRAWEPQVAALRERYRVVAVDLRRHGDSTSEAPFTFDDAVDDVLAVIAALDPERLALVGLSLGGNIAQEIVHRDAGRAQALVIADSTCNTAPRPPVQKAAAIVAVQNLVWYPRALFLRAATHVTAREPRAREYVRATTATMPQRDVVRVLSSLLTSALRADPDYDLPVPTLLVHGEHDRVGDIAAGSSKWARKDHRIEHHVIPSASHLSNLDAPEEFNQRLGDFLDRHMQEPAGSSQVQVRPRWPARFLTGVLRRRSGRGATADQFSTADGP